MKLVSLYDNIWLLVSDEKAINTPQSSSPVPTVLVSSLCLLPVNKELWTI